MDAEPRAAVEMLSEAQACFPTGAVKATGHQGRSGLPHTERHLKSRLHTRIYGVCFLLGRDKRLFYREQKRSQICVQQVGERERSISSGEMTLRAVFSASGQRRAHTSKLISAH